jgi:hypothetical protein
MLELRFTKHAEWIAKDLFIHKSFHKKFMLELRFTKHAEWIAKDL